MPDFAELDREVFRAIHLGWHNDGLDKPALLVTYTGDGWQIVPVLLCTLKREWRSVALRAAVAWAASGLIRLPIMWAVGRERPGNLGFAHPLEDILGRSSFPSGHTTTTWAIALTVCLFCSGSRANLIRVGVLLWAVLVGLSRIYVGVHYPFDVVGGIALGALTAGVIKLAWPIGTPDVSLSTD